MKQYIALSIVVLLIACIFGASFLMIASVEDAEAYAVHIYDCDWGSIGTNAGGINCTIDLHPHIWSH